MPKRFSQSVKEGSTVPAVDPSTTDEVDPDSEYDELMMLAAEPLDLDE